MASQIPSLTNPILKEGLSNCTKYQFTLSSDISFIDVGRVGILNLLLNQPLFFGFLHEHFPNKALCMVFMFKICFRAD